MDKKEYLPMCFRLNFCCFDDNYDLIDTDVCIDFDKKTITFSNPKTPVDEARLYVSQLPDFFNIRHIVIGSNDL